MGSKQYEPFEKMKLVKSNEMVSAKYRSTLLENQITSIALARLEYDATNVNAPLSAKLKSSELKHLISDESNIYKTLKGVAQTMVGHTIFMEDRKGNFEAHAIITSAEYKNGDFTVHFNEMLRPHLLGLEKNYTTLELSVLTDLKKSSSFRIYELLKRELYKSKPDVNNGRVDVEYNLAEFRFMIGLANIDDPLVRNELSRSGGNINWDVMYAKLDKRGKKYEKWYELSRCIIVPAQKELEEKSNIRFDFEGIKTGRSIGRVRFEVYPNDNIYNKPEIKAKKKILEKSKAQIIDIEAYNLDELPSIYREFIGHNRLTKDDIDALMYRAGNDESEVREAIKYADEQSEHVFIENYVGYLLKCIEEEWYKAPIAVTRGSADRGERIKTITEEINKSVDNGQPSDGLLKASWNMVKKQEQFIDFTAYIEASGLTIEQLEVLYPYKKLVGAYIDFKMGRPVDLGEEE